MKRLLAFFPIALLVLIWTVMPSARAVTPTFTQVIVQAGQGAWGNNLGDLDGDGALDIVEGGGDLGGSVYWYAAPTWTRFQIGSDGGGDDLQIGDINRDGAPDVVVDGAKMVWYENPRGTGGNVQGAWTKHSIDAATGSHDIELTDLNADGRIDVAIRQQEGKTYYYLQGATADTWTKVLISQAPDGHGGLAAGDINRDGRIDLVENGFWLEAPVDLVSGVWIRHDFSVWAYGSSVTLHDINHDGRLDIFIAVSESGAGQLAWFEAPLDPIGGTWVRHNIDNVEDVHRFFLVDMDKDGTEDLVFAEMHQSAGKRVGVYYNSGLGASWTLQVLSTQGSHNIAVGDIGNDGDVDIIGSNWATSAPDGGAQKLWRNDLNNAMSLDTWAYKQVDGSKSDVAFGLAFGDLDNDGRKDIISGQYWYRNPGGNMSGTWTRTSFGSDYDAMLVMDVDGNGRLDVIAQSPVGNNVGIYWLSPNATATAFNVVLVGTIPASRDVISQGYTISQLTVGSRPQVIFSDDQGFYALTIPANPLGGNWPQIHVDSTGAQEGVAPSDIDRDGRVDLVGTSHVNQTAHSHEVDWWKNPGTGLGNWSKFVVGTTTYEADRIAVADINQDGRPDVIATDSDYDISKGNLSWFEQQAGGTWVKHVVVTDIGSLASMDVGDFNKDGRIDIVVGEHQGNPLRVLVFENVAGGASWVSHTVDTGKESHEGTRVEDLDGDGDLDIVSIAYNAHQFLHLWRNDATALAGDTTPPVITGVGSGAIAQNGATISWSTNEAADGRVEYGLTSTYGSTTALSPALVLSHAIPITGLSPSTTYHYRVLSSDNSANQAALGDFTFTTGTVDSTVPNVSILTPAQGATVSGAVNLTASASDNVGVVGVTYFLDSGQIGTEITSSPYTYAWDTVTASNGNHSLTAVARDAAGNQTTSVPVAVTVSNVAPPPSAVAFRQSAGSSVDAFATTMVIPFPSATLPGNLIAVAVSWGNNATLACADSQANVYTVLPAQYDNVNNQSFGICYAPNVKAGATSVTATFNSSASYRRMIVHEYSGIATSSPVDVTVSNLANGTTGANAITSMSAMTTVPGTLIFGAVMDDAGTTTIQAGTGFAARGSVSNDLFTEDRVFPSAGSVAATWTFSSSHRYISRMVAFKPGAPADVALPQVSVTAPTEAASVSGNVTLTATASDNVGVIGLQFKVDNVNVGAEITNGNYTFVWDSTALANGPHNVRATARDAAGNIETSTVVNIDVNNVDGTPPGFQNITATNITTMSATIGWTTTEPATSQVEYGPDSNYGSFTTLNPALTTPHSQLLSGLSPATTYFFKVLSSDAAGNPGSATGTFTTATPDSTPPAISNVNAGAITLTSATITWTTNEPATTQVQYGPDTDYAFSTSLNPSMTTGHTQPLSGLSPGTVYFYRVLSNDASGNPGSATSTFMTVTPDTVPPALSSPTVTNVSSSAATISWTTNEASTTQVAYGLSSAYGQSTTLNAALVTSHSQQITNLQAGTVYHFQAASTDAATNTGLSGDATFTTLAGEPAVPAVSLLSRWKFNDQSGTTAADSAGTAPGTLSNFACLTMDCNATSGWASAGRFLGALNFDGTNDVVNAGTTPFNDLASFSYAAWIFPRSLGEGSAGRIVDKSGTGYKRFRLNNATVSSFYAEVRHSTTNAVATSAANTVTLNQWQHVVMTYDGPTRVLRIYKNGVQIATATGAGTPQSDATGSLLIGNNPAGSATFNGLIDDVVVYNRALAVSEVQTLASGAPDLAAPQFSAITSSGTTTTATTITWNTDEIADTSVEYGLTTDYGTTTPVNSALVLAHSVPLSGLTQSTTYHFRVVSRDSSGNVAPSVDGTFTTVTPDTTFPTVSLVTPAAGTVSGTINITASANDNVGVASVQYFLDGSVAVSGLLAANPYTFAWNTVSAANGAHTLTAVAKDAAGNTTTSDGVIVNVSNAASPVGFVQSAASNNNNGATTIVQALPAPATLGNLIVVAVSWGNNATLACSDSQGNVYTVLPTQYDSTNNQSLGICYAPNVKAGATSVTATFSSSPQYRRILVHEYRGIAKTSPVDVTTATIANGTTAANAITTGSVTTTAAGDLIFAAVMDDAGTATIQAGTGFTFRVVTSSDLASEDRIQPAAGAIAGTFTFSASHRYMARIVAFKSGG